MNNRVPKLIASAFLVVTLATACGGDGGRPSVDDISGAMEDNAGDILGDMPEDSIDFDCLAEAYHDSDISDDTLQAMVDGDEDYDPSDKDTELLTQVATDEGVDCISVPSS